jgi:hypothetical protein
MKLSFKLMVIVGLNYGNKGLSLPLAIAEIPANQMDHDKSALCESRIYVCGSATPPFSARVSQEC